MYLSVKKKFDFAEHYVSLLKIIKKKKKKKTLDYWWILSRDANDSTRPTLTRLASTFTPESTQVDP